MTNDKCPVCGTQHSSSRDDNAETDLCNDCNEVRFYMDDGREAVYRFVTYERVKELKNIFGDDYNNTLHRGMVEQMVRCEIAIDRYDRLIANDNEAPQTAELLKSERAHWNKVADKLNMTIRAIRGDTKNIKYDFGDNFKDYLKAMLNEEEDEEEGIELGSDSIVTV